MNRFIALILFATTVSHTAMATSAYVVDDASIVDKDKIQNESWYTHGARNVEFGVSKFAAQLLPNTEFSLQETHAFQPNGDNVLTPEMKHQLYLSDDKFMETSVVLGANYATFQSRTGVAYLYVPVSLNLIPHLRTDINLGWQYENQTSRHYMTWGLGGEYQMTKKTSIIGGVFGRTTKVPAGQLGTYFQLTNWLGLDVIYGRNVFDTEENSGTIGVRLALN